MSRGKYSAVAQAGMEILDEYKPGWEGLIDPETLNLESCSFCVLGQVYGDYDAGKVELNLHKGNEHGFDVGKGDSRHYSLLTRAWLRVISKRLTSKLNKISNVSDALSMMYSPRFAS